MGGLSQGFTCREVERGWSCGSDWGGELHAGSKMSVTSTEVSRSSRDEDEAGGWMSTEGSGERRVWRGAALSFGLLESFGEGHVRLGEEYRGRFALTLPGFRRGDEGTSLGRSTLPAS